MLKLSTEVEGHKHIVYLRDTAEPESILSSGEGIIGMTSMDDDHQHEVWMSPERVEVDPQTQQQIVTPARIYLQEVMGHTHEIEMDYLQVDPSKRDNKEIKNEDKESERYNEYLKIAVQSYDHDESYYRPQGLEAEKMYHGGLDQWPDSVQEELKNQERPMLTFNTIKSKINNIIGMFSANPLMPKVKPTEGSDARLADIYNALNAHLFARCDFPALQKDIFSDQVITGRGNIDIKIDTTQNPEGEPMLKPVEWDQVTYMPHNNKDLSDCEGVCQWEWVTKDYLKMIAPEHKKEDIENLSTNSEMANLPTGISSQSEFSFSNTDNKTFKLMSVTRKEYKKRTVIFNVSDNYYLDGHEGAIPSWLLDPKTQKRILTIPGFEKTQKTVCEYWVGTIGANILLYDRLSEFNGYLTIPAFATKRKNRIKGEIADLIDPQIEKNKRQTLFIENLMKMASDVIYIDGDTFGGDNTKLQAFKANRSKPGAVIEIDDVAKPPVEKSPPRFPTELLSLAQQMERDMDLISGFNNEGIAGLRNASSTPLFRERRQSALMSIEYLFSNFNILLRQLALRLVEMYRVLYTPERVWRILENHHVKLVADGGQGLSLSGLPFQQYNYQAIKDIWDNADQIKYDIAIDYSSYSTTKADDDFATFATLGQQGVPGITAEFLLELKTDINPEVKDKLIQIAQQAQQQQAQMSQQAGQMEIQKVQIGQQGQNQRLHAELQNDNAQFAANLALEEEKIEQSTSKD
jgi:hypothetical protein